MLQFDYQAMTAEGKKVAGSLDAANDREVKEKLRAQGLFILDVSLKKRGRGKDRLKGDDLVSFTLLLSQLCGSGVPLFESLLAVEEQYRGEPFHRVIRALCDDIRGGSSLSQAMGKHPSSFDRLYCSMVEAGELSGTLGKVLEELSSYLSRQMELKKQLTTALVYPAVLAGFSVFILVVLLTFVVPSIESIFEERKVNGFTAFVLGASHVFRDYWWLLLTAGASAIFGAIYFLKTPQGVAWRDATVLKVPLIRRVAVLGAVGRFCRTMATLQGGGVTLIDSMRVAREVMRNGVLEEEVRKAEQKVIEGSSLSLELKRSPWFPPLLSRMIAVGEESGTMVAMFQRISHIYEGDLEKTLTRVVALAQPVILIVMGGIIGVVLMAVLLPMGDFSALTME